MEWNGAIGADQLEWLKDELAAADADEVSVVLLSHFPVYPDDKHNLWNAQNVLEAVKRSASVKAWFNGHNHAGNYGQTDGVHFVTFKGMVDTSETAFAIVELSETEISIEGVGCEPSRQ